VRRALAALALLGAGCGAPAAGDGRILAQVAADAGPHATPDITDTVRADERLAADVLRQEMKGGHAERAAWAAVYARRLGIKHDEAASGALLVRCASSKDAFLAALCWRWLAADPSIALPPWPEAASDPIVQVMAGLAAARRGETPRGLASALGSPQGEPDPGVSQNDGRLRVQELLALAVPFDNGPLAIALAFLEARREGWVEAGADKKPAWTAVRLRDELARAVAEDDEAMRRAVSAAKRERHPIASIVLDVIDTPLARQEASALHGPAVRGTPSLRVAALRALAAAAREPTAKDLGAAAASLRAEDADVRLEGARTFLILALRSYD
jgi:hypothetical protein